MLSHPRPVQATVLSWLFLAAPCSAVERATCRNKFCLRMEKRCQMLTALTISVCLSGRAKEDNRCQLNVKPRRSYLRSHDWAGQPVTWRGQMSQGSLEWPRSALHSHYVHVHIQANFSRQEPSWFVQDLDKLQASSSITQIPPGMSAHAGPWAVLTF